MTKEEVIATKNRWLRTKAIEGLGITDETPIHKIFEAVYVNVSMSFKMHWNDIIYAKNEDYVGYTARTVMMVLLHKCLLKYSKIYDAQSLKVLLGGTNFDIVAKFHENTN